MKPPFQPFIEQLGLHYEASGLPRTAGRLVGFLLTNADMHSLDELAAQLQVSKASISTNARLLEQRGLIQRASKPGDRRDYYRIADNPWEQLIAFGSERLSAARRLFEAASTVLPDVPPDARARIAGWAAFYAFLLEDLDHRAARWREQRGA